MPNLLIPIPHTYDTVSRRVAKSVIDKVIKISSMDKTSRVEIRGESQVAAQPGSELGDGGLLNRLQHDGRVVVTFRETYVESEAINSEVRHPYTQPIFNDQSIGIHIKPVYSNTDMELTFSFRTKSKSEAVIWKDGIRVRMADNRQAHLHQADYHFPVPNFCSTLLMHMYELREGVAGYGEDLGTYLKKHYTKRATVLTTQSGDDSNTLLVIAEKQLGIQGWFEFDFPVEEEKNEDGPSYVANFTYRFSYYKPLELHVVYPQVVHNQLISEDYLLGLPETEDPLQLPTYQSDYRFALDHFDYSARQLPNPLGGLRIPEYDEWIPSSIVSWTTSLINWMIVFEPKDLTLVLAENDILDTGFSEDILQFMRHQGNRMTRKGHSALHFGLFRGDQPVADGDLKVVVTDNAFKVVVSTPADLRQTYHLRLSFCTNIAYYTQEALEDLANLGHKGLLLLQTVVNNLDVEDACKNHVTNGRLSPEWIKRFYDYLYGQAVGLEQKGNFGNKSPGRGSPINNNIYGDGNWFRDDPRFKGSMDIPYVQYLTIIPSSKNKGDV